MSVTHVVGDIHGHLEKLVTLLRDAKLIGRDLAWTGADSILWFMGDLVDHGHDGVAVIEMVMRLQREAAGAGGSIGTLVGNHDVLLLSAHCFGAVPSSGKGGTFLSEWQHNGGEQRDIERLTADHVHWLTALPAMARVGDSLLVHADALLYEWYGQSIDEVNRTLIDVLHSGDSTRWNQLLGEFGKHHAFIDGERGEARARAFLRRFGGTRIVHGHSPISSITDEPAEEVREPLVYGDGLCIDVDGGMYLGGPGFVCRLPSAAAR